MISTFRCYIIKQKGAVALKKNVILNVSDEVLSKSMIWLTAPML